MKNFRMFINEMKSAESIEELESGADLFQYGCDKGYYSVGQAKEFNTIYHALKTKINDEIMCSEIYKENMDIPYLQALTIIRHAPDSVKQDKKDLKVHIKKILKALRNTKSVS